MWETLTEGVDSGTQGTAATLYDPKCDREVGDITAYAERQNGPFEDAGNLCGSETKICETQLKL